MFARRPREDDDEAEGEREGETKHPEVEIDPGPSSLSWDLGYSFTTPSVASGATRNLDLHTFSVGLDWEAGSSVDLEVGFAIGTIPSQDYRNGRVAMRFESFTRLPLDEWLSDDSSSRRKKMTEEEEEEDARFYFLKRRQEDAARLAGDGSYAGNWKRRKRQSRTAGASNADGDTSPPPGPQDRYPQLVAALDVSFDQHLLSLAAGESRLNQFAVGPDLELSWNPRVDFRLAGLYFGYSSSPKPFAAAMTSSTAVSYLFPRASLAAAAPQPLAFPEFVFEEGVSYDLTERFTVELHLNQVLYALASRAAAFGFAPQLRARLGSRWELGAGAGVLVGGPGSVVAGLLNVSFRI